MKRLKILFVLPVVLILNCCASSKIEPLYYKDGVVNLAGMWVLADENKPEMDVMLDLAFVGDDLSLKVWGKTVESYRFLQNKNQFLISYKTDDGQQFNLLAQIEKGNQMRLSQTMEAVPDFVPIGQLGEKVFRLTRLKENRTYVTSATGKH